MTLTVLDRLADGFLDSPAANLIRVLPGPTLFDLPGRLDNPLFASVLLHGNEETGLLAIQEVLAKYRDKPLPRRLLLFVGNVAAAARGRRTLDRQLDYNRAWPGTPHMDAPEAALMREVVDYASRQRPFASIDLHNNTGLNPHYACVNRLEDRFLHLARLFGRTVVFFDEPKGVQSEAMAKICPAVTVECGKTGERSATAHAVEFIEAALSLAEFPSHAPQHADFDLLRTFAIVKVPSDVTFSFDGSDADIRFRGDLDHLNFNELEAGTPFGTIHGDPNLRLELISGIDDGVSEYFDYSGNRIRLAVPAIPSMLTRSVEAVRLDCLCYVMHRIDFAGRRLRL
jgi:succinylglutamate desuccinylase